MPRRQYKQDNSEEFEAMALVIEGIDGSGKSTLIKMLMHTLQLHGRSYVIQSSEGPPKHPGEMNERIRGYRERERSQRGLRHAVIFDRHPCVSNPIYDVMRRYEDKPIDPIDPELIKEFYADRHLLVYCYPVMFKHDVKPGEDPEHVAGVERHYQLMKKLYDDWGLQHASMIYRIGDDPSHVYHQVFK